MSYQNIIERIKNINEFIGISEGNDESLSDKLDRIEDKVDNILLSVNKVTEDDLINKKEITIKFNIKDLIDNKIIINEVKDKYIYYTNIKFVLDNKVYILSDEPGVVPYNQYKFDINYDLIFRDNNKFNVTYSEENTEYDINNIFTKDNIISDVNEVFTYKLDMPNYPGSYDYYLGLDGQYSAPKVFTNSNIINKGDNIYYNNYESGFMEYSVTGTNFSFIKFYRFNKSAIKHFNLKNTLLSHYIGNNGDQDRIISYKKTLPSLSNNFSSNILFTNGVDKLSISDNELLFMSNTNISNGYNFNSKSNPIYIDKYFEIKINKIEFIKNKLNNIHQNRSNEINENNKNKELITNEWHPRSGIPVGQYRTHSYVSPEYHLGIVAENKGPSSINLSLDYYNKYLKNMSYGDSLTKDDIIVEVTLKYGEFITFN